MAVFRVEKTKDFTIMSNHHKNNAKNGKSSRKKANFTKSSRTRNHDIITIDYYMDECCISAKEVKTGHTAAPQPCCRRSLPPKWHL